MRSRSPLMSRAMTLCTTAVSLFRINVRSSGRHKCHSGVPPWYPDPGSVPGLRGTCPGPPRWRTLGVQVSLDRGSVDSQRPLDRSQRHPLASGFLNRLPSLLLEERRLAGNGGSRGPGSGRAVGVGSLILLVLYPWGQWFETRYPAFAKPLAPEGGTGGVAERWWPVRRNAGLGGASWAATMRPSCRTASRPSSPSRTPTAAPA